MPRKSLLRSSLKSIRRLFRRGNAAGTSALPLFFFNTLVKDIQEFTPAPHSSVVRMYNCGPTVYGRQHIGNLSMFVFADTLRRTLEYNRFEVKQVINFTDFGHLSGDNAGDADQGEDRMTKGLKAEGLDITMANMRTLARKYAGIFLEDIKLLNIDTEKITFPYASDYIPAQIAMIQTLEEKGYAYKISDGVYFDTSRFPTYGALGGIDLAGLKEGARVKVHKDKRNPTDFALWKFLAKGESTDENMGWDSPWGTGFPGWHIECSAMIHSILGKQIDIHTGGIEHISIHHNNEIAQSEAATGKKPFSRFWMHRAHIQLDGGKIAKSEGNVVYLSDIVGRGFDPLIYRYWLLGAHYRTPANFSWDALEAARLAYQKLLQRMKDLNLPGEGTPPREYQRRFHERINDDLDTAGALAVVWEMIKDPDLSPKDVAAGVIDADRILGLNLGGSIQRRIGITLRETVSFTDLPVEIKKTVEKREAARASKDFATADNLRREIEEKGYELEDTGEGPRVTRKQA